MVGKYLTLVCVLLAFLSLGNAHYHGRNRHKIVKRQSVACDAKDRFRTEDGQCNNLNNPTWGSAGAFLERLATPAYRDGISQPRTQSGTIGNPDLPRAREVSVKCHKADDVRGDVTLMVMQWGQFLDHDMTLTPHVSIDDDCCTASNSECFSIPLVSDEYFTGRTCMPFIRSHRETATGSTVQQQTNSLTSFIDASNVYGSSAAETDELRGDNGELKDVTFERKEHYLPESSVPNSCMNSTGEYCFLAGDDRVNEQPGLAAMHTIWMRQHNKIAREFKSKTDWSSDRIFKETRKIVGAMMQVITYNEFLPIVLGNTFYNAYALQNSVYQYQSTLNPGIINAFATAAYRFGHSLIPDSVTVNGQELFFKDMFLSPTEVLNNMDQLTSALVDERSMDADRDFAHSVTRHLFQTEERNGFDLVALNIQRGRDHGLPAFNVYRQLCHHTPLKSLGELFPGDATAQSAYLDINDVDLFTGGMSEPPVPEGLVGPTFACILGVQFNLLKYGDRFFYLNKEGNQRFSDSQIAELNKVSLSKVICDNTERSSIQKNIFKPAKATSNPTRSCRDIPRIKLDVFISGGGTGGGGRDGGKASG